MYCNTWDWTGVEVNGEVSKVHATMHQFDFNMNDISIKSEFCNLPAMNESEISIISVAFSPLLINQPSRGFHFLCFSYKYVANFMNET